MRCRPTLLIEYKAAAHVDETSAAKEVKGVEEKPLGGSLADTTAIICYRTSVRSSMVSLN